MRIAILALSSAALVACGGATASTTADVIDAATGDGAGRSGDASGYDGASNDAAADAPPDASDGDTGPGDAGSGGGAFACGDSSCTAPQQYCSITITGSMCLPVPFGCPAALPTCGCVEPIDGGFPGCTCQDGQGRVTITCR
jgi:hypothetical protein